MSRCLFLLFFTASLVSLSGCASFYANVHPDIANKYGSIDFAQASGTSNIRLLANPERTYSYGQSTTVSDVDSLKIIDVALEFKRDNDVPLYRIMLRPRNLSTQDWQSLPKILNILVGIEASDERFVLSTNLPDKLDNSVTRSPWTYCAKCLKLNPSTQKSYNLNLNHQINRLATSSIHKFSYFLVTFEDSPKTTYQTGKEVDLVVEAARERKQRIAREKAAERERLRLEKLQEQEYQRLYGEVRNAYQELANQVKSESLSQKRLDSCGSLTFPSLPNPRYASADEISNAAQKSKDAYKAHVICVNRFLNQINTEQWGPHLASLAEMENRLWPQTFLPADKRQDALTLSEALEFEKAYIKKLEQDYSKQVESLQALWKDYEYYEERRREQARKSKIEDEVKRCLYSLASRGALTQFSEGYCRTQAEKGMSGYQAGIIGAAGSAPVSNSNLLYQSNELPNFDLEGMIENAQAVTDGASVDILWGPSGAIRTSRAPEVAVFRGGKNNDADGSSKALSNGPSLMNRSTNKVLESPNETLNNDTSDTSIELGSGSTQDGDDWPERFSLTYVEDKGMKAGAIQLFSYKTVKVDFIGDQVVAARVKPFVVSNKQCDASGKIQASLHFVVGAYWNNPSWEEVLNTQALANKSPLILLNPAGESANDLQQVVNALGNRYQGKDVYWQTTEQFRRSLTGSACKIIVWNGDFESRIPIR